MQCGIFAQDCRKCKRVGPDWRKRWGCDEPSPAPFAYIRCHRCYGEDPDCELCKGHLYGVPQDVCPFKAITPTTALALAWYGDWKEGRLPVDGGILDQPAAYVRAMKFLDGFINQYQADEYDKIRKESERNARKAAQGGLGKR